MKETHVPPMFIAALFIIARTWKQPRCPSASLQTINAGEVVEKREPSYIVDGNAN